MTPLMEGRPRPLVSLNMASTIDGHTTLPDGSWHGLTSNSDRQQMDRYRIKADYLIAGVNSILRDNPNLYPDKVPNLTPDQAPTPVVLCRTTLPPRESRLFVNSPLRPTLILARELESPSKEYREVADLVIRPYDEINPFDTLVWIYEKGGRQVLLEGGPTLNRAFFESDLVDQLHMTIVPWIIGDGTLHSILAGNSPLPEFTSRRWRLVSCEPVEDEVFITYRRHRN